MTYILGVDAGNTKTIALVARVDGTILGVGRAGCGDIYATTPEAAITQTTEAITAALRQADIQPVALAAGGFSMAGADWPEDFTLLRQVYASYGEKIVVVNDAMGALRAGSPDGTGVVVACGTGAATGARNANGQAWHTSFWQEPQGGHELARKAMAAVYRAALGVEQPTSLTSRVLDYFGQPSVESLLHLFTSREDNHPDNPMITRLAPVVLDEAANGDAVARRILQTHGAALGDYALAAARRVNIEKSAFTLVLAGGVFRHPGRLLAESLIERVRAVSPAIRPTFSRFEPVIGALLLALESICVAVDEPLLEKITVSAPRAEIFQT